DCRAVYSTILRLPRPTLFPYTTLFRSCGILGNLSGRLVTQRTNLASEMTKQVTLHHCRGNRDDEKNPYESCADAGLDVDRRPDRSEEHTSELQSRFDLVCRLLLEKKNK